MKHFIKSTIAVIVALTVLATLSVVGFSASAKDVAVLSVVTEKDDKKVEDMFITKEGSTAEETFNVVDSKTLGNAIDGLPSKAYAATFKAGQAKDGFIIKTESPDIPAWGRGDPSAPPLLRRATTAGSLPPPRPTGCRVTDFFVLGF